jgi:hypothetical protein
VQSWRFYELGGHIGVLAVVKDPFVHHQSVRIVNHNNLRVVLSNPRRANKRSGISVEKAAFDETLFVEMASILISGRFTIHFATAGTSYSATMKFDMSK